MQIWGMYHACYWIVITHSFPPLWTISTRPNKTLAFGSCFSWGSRAYSAIMERMNGLLLHSITGDISKCLMSQNKNYSYCKYDFICNNKFNEYDIRPFYSTYNLLFGIKLKWSPWCNNITCMLHGKVQRHDNMT